MPPLFQSQWSPPADFYQAQSAVQISASMKERIHSFSYSELNVATNGFDEEFILGKGGSGVVYRGCIKNMNDGQKQEIAVKCIRLPALDARTKKLFKAEVDLLADLSHPHIVPLLGVCLNPADDKVMLVYKFLEGGSLDYYLHGGLSGMHLTWLERLRICRDVAKGLDYLHQNRVIHRDVKPGNIVLDKNMKAHLTDFGLARKLPRAKSYIRTEVFGTRGYMDPTYLSSGSVCMKSDVYSFGVLLLELITGRSVVTESGFDLIKWSRPIITNKRPHIQEVLDPSLLGEVHEVVFQNAILTVRLCLLLNIDERPKMEMVVHMMKRLVEEAEGKVQFFAPPSYAVGK